MASDEGTAVQKVVWTFTSGPTVLQMERVEMEENSVNGLTIMCCMYENRDDGTGRACWKSISSLN